jgi:hypothetical protein
MDFIKYESFNNEWTAWIRSHEGVSDNLISDVDLEMNGPGRQVAVGGGAGGGSLELCGPTAPKLGFQHGFLLRHHDDVANLFCSPWDDGGRWWQLVTTVSLL